MAEFTVTTDLSVVRDLKITANFDELKAALTEKVESYRTMLVTPENTAAAKSDLANLRRVQRDIDTVRLAWKREYMAPWDEFEAKCKELKSVLDSGIANLDTQVKAFEEAEVNAKMDALRQYFEQNVLPTTRSYADFDKISAAHPKWKNKTYDMTAAQNDIQVALAEIDRGLDALRAMEEPYKTPMLAKFAENYRLDDAMNVMAQMKRQEQLEKARLEAEARMKAAAEAQKAAEAARAAQEATNEIERELTRQMQESRAESVNEPVSAIVESQATKRVEFWVEITTEQGRALGAFLKANGIRYGSVRR